MALQILMTSDCQVICVGENGKFYLRSLSDDVLLEEIVALTQRGTHWYLRSVVEPIRWYDVNERNMVSLFPAEAITLDNRGMGLNVLSVHNYYLSADWSGKISFDTQDASAAMVVRCVALDDILLLRKMVNENWVCGPEGRQVQIKLAQSTLENIIIGSVQVSFEQFIEAARQYEQHNELLLNEEWKIWRFVRYKPLIVMEVFEESALQELPIALQSLFEIGQYDGDVLIATDQSENEIKALISTVYESFVVRIVTVKNYDRFSSLRTRFRLIGNPDILDNYTPLVFMNSGIVFDAKIEEFLGRSALSRHILAQNYFYHPEFILNQKEHECAEKLDAGQTADLLVVPHIVRHRPYLEKAFDLLMLCIKEYGAQAIPMEASTIIVYGLRQVGDFSSNLLDQAVQYEGSVGLNSLYAGGFMTFKRDSGRHKRMTQYLNIVQKLWGDGG